MVQVKEVWVLQHWHYYKDRQVQVGCVVFQNDSIAYLLERVLFILKCRDTQRIAEMVTGKYSQR